jgi:glycosyltransferase involved in cell wall biosynthesis
VRIIPNGVNLDDYDNVEPVNLGYPYIFAMGRMVPQKGFDHLIHAFQRIADWAPTTPAQESESLLLPDTGASHDQESLPQTDAQQLPDQEQKPEADTQKPVNAPKAHSPPPLHLVFGGEGVYRRDYEILVNHLNMQERIHFLGLVQGPKKISFLKGAEFFVCPSRYEPFGIVVLEAMASGIPVIANRVGGIVDILEDGVTGRLVAAADTQELAEMILSLSQDSERRREMGLAARKKAEQYDWKIVNQKYLEMYQMAIATSKKPNNATNR